MYVLLKIWRERNMLVYRGPHFRVVLRRFYVALFGETALFSGVINVLIPSNVKYIQRIFFVGAESSQERYQVASSPATSIISLFFLIILSRY